MSRRSCVGITMGDPAGIGAEIIVKALLHRDIYERCFPVVIGDAEAIKDAITFCRSNQTIHEIKEPSEALGLCGTVDVIDLKLLGPKSWEYGKVSSICGEVSFQYVEKAIELAMRRVIDAVVTAPINKEAINLAGHEFSGHTEIFARYTDSKKYAMLLCSGNLRVIHVSTHVSLREACDRATKERILEVIELAGRGMELLGIDNPRIGVSGLNPHCSENGLFGKEEIREIIPAIEEARRMGFDVDGPVPPDSVFVKCLGGAYDVVVAMYHDQGHIPLKLQGFKLEKDGGTYSSISGINCTLGLPIIRTSVDHGTAFGKAGKGRANEGSMVEAIHAGVVMANNMFFK